LRSTIDNRNFAKLRLQNFSAVPGIYKTKPVAISSDIPDTLISLLFAFGTLRPSHCGNKTYSQEIINIIIILPLIKYCFG
jgi:hypothetical protein